MCVLAVMFAATLGLIYFSSYREAYQKNTLMLERYAEAFWQNGNPDGQETPPPPEDEAGAPGDRIYSLSTFYAVEFSDVGDALSVDNSDNTGFSDEALIALCQPLSQLAEGNGVSDNWIYRVEHQNGETLVVLMDNIVMSDNMATLFNNMLLYGVIAIVLLLVPAFWMARAIVKPLEENFQKQRQFISDAGHELKTPIAVISANAEMLERGGVSNQWLENIRYENNHMGELVKQLLQLARAENVAPAMAKLDFSRLVTGSVLPFEIVAFEKEQTLSLQVQENVELTGNTEQLGNLISILVENALEYAPEGSVICISLKTEQHAAVLSVSNEGEDISESELENLFDRFYRRDEARSNTGGHYGLGLAIAKAIVTAHGGKIAVSCLKRQITFEARLPANT